MTKDEARKELLETLEEYCHDKGYNLQVFAGMANWVYTLYPLQKKMTNADKIRSMTDEQLSVLLRMGACQLCAYASKNYDCCCPDNENCRDGHLKWLQEEYKKDWGV